MIEGFAHTGFWFLPDKPDQQVTGTLYFEPNEEPRLELTGTLMEPSNESIDFILGYITDGKIVTLYKSYESKRHVSMPGINVCEYIPMYILLGRHFANEKEFKFKVIDGHFNNLEKWVDILGFQEVKTDDETHETKIYYKLPDPIDFLLGDNTKGSLNFTASVPFHKHVHKAIIQQWTGVRLEFETEKSFDEALDKILLIQNFLTLATFETAYPLNIVVVKQNSVDVRHSTRVNVIYKAGFKLQLNKSSTRHTFLFSYSDIIDSFPAIIQKWVSQHDKIKPVTNLLLDSFYNENFFDENKFLNIIHALETFHRRFRKNEVLSTEEHQKRINSIVDSVDEDAKEWLRDRLSFTNEPNLHQRLEELLSEAWNETTAEIIFDKDQFIRDAKNSRNYYTHYDPRSERKALKGTALFYLTQRLRIILVILILKETGLNKKTIDRVVGLRAKYFRSLYHNNS